MLQDKTKSDTVKCPVSGSTLPSTMAGSVSCTLLVTTLLSFMLVGYKACGICVKKMGEIVTVGLFPKHPRGCSMYACVVQKRKARRGCTEIVRWVEQSGRGKVCLRETERRQTK